MAKEMNISTSRVVVVTDLDGSLLDYFTYSWEAALPAISLLKRRKIPLVFCTSKTLAELVYLQTKMRIFDPFISETGGAIWFPPRCVKGKLAGAKKVGQLYAIILGLPYRALRSALVAYREEYNLDLVGFGDLPPERVAKLCDVPIEVGRLVKMRDFDEPFFFTTPPTSRLLEKMRRDFARQGMRIIQGGRFYHLVGKSDKGQAISRLRQWYEEKSGGSVTIVGLGDSPNDIALFAASDIPILIKRHDGRYHPLVRAAIRTRLAGDVGPVGWNRAVLKILGEKTVW